MIYADIAAVPSKKKKKMVVLCVYMVGKKRGWGGGGGDAKDGLSDPVMTEPNLTILVTYILTSDMHLQGSVKHIKV